MSLEQCVHVTEEVQAHQHLFEESPFYQLMTTDTTESILEALELVTNKKVDVHLISHKVGTDGWNYLHFLVERCVVLNNLPIWYILDQQGKDTRMASKKKSHE